MKSEKPKIGSGRAVRWAHELYGIKTLSASLPGYIDCNFLLEQPDGTQTVLKIGNADCNRAEIEGQVQVMRHLENSSIGSLVPQIIPDLEGRDFSEVKDTEGSTYLIRMISYIDGSPLAKFGASNRVLRQKIGLTLGLLDSELQTFDHPGVHRNLVWDLTRVLELQPLQQFVDPEILPYVTKGLDRFSRTVQPRLSELRTSVIHNDANDYNILVRPDDTGNPQLCGLIDFGDVVHTVTVAEVAIACAYAMLNTPDPATACSDVVRGYEESYPLQPIERSALPDLIVGRLCASILMSAKARNSSPENQYLSISEKPVTALLKRIL